MLSVSSGRRIVCITGGSGFRKAALEIVKLTHRSSHLIGIADNWRSSGVLRRFFEMEALGDIRSRLIDLADTEAPGFRESTNLLKHRLSKDATQRALEQELDDILTGRHPKSQALYASKDAPGFAEIIIKHIKFFADARPEAEEHVGEEFDLRRASIGNLFLTGAYLDYERNIESAIFLYNGLGRVRGDVIPATFGNIHLAAMLEDGTELIGQHVISHVNTSLSPIARLYYIDSLDGATCQELHPELNPRAAKALKEAEMIVYCIGSLRTSLEAVLKLQGIAEPIRESEAIKVFTANPIEDAETRGMTAGTMAAEIISTLRDADSCPSSNDNDYLQHMIVGDHTARSMPDGRILVPTDHAGLDLRVTQSPLEPITAHFQPKPLVEKIFGLFDA
ncbi:2-phospho-L-lactate transferase CofD family protein [Candidatus Margulisiibacteriota bacterium]